MTVPFDLRPGIYITYFDVLSYIYVYTLLLDYKEVKEGIINLYKTIGFEGDYLNEGFLYNGSFEPYTLTIDPEDLPRQHEQITGPLVYAKAYAMLAKILRAYYSYVDKELGYILYRPNRVHLFEQYASKYLLDIAFIVRYFRYNVSLAYDIVTRFLYQYVYGYDGTPISRRREANLEAPDGRILETLYTRRSRASRRAEALYEGVHRE